LTPTGASRQRPATTTAIKADSYIRPLLGAKRVRDVTPEVVLAWQRRLMAEGGPKSTKPLSSNTVRLARAPLAGAFKMAVKNGIIAADPIAHVSRPIPRRSIPSHWSPEHARTFPALMEADRTYPIWAFLMGSGLRIGELVALRWPNVDLDAGIVRIVEFSSYLGHQLVASNGKSPDAVRSIDIDAGLAGVLRAQRALQASERLAGRSYEDSDDVFTRPAGGPYHAQYLSRLLGRYSAELGLPRLTAHGLRHTCATLMLANGVLPKVAAERLGHADPTLLRTCTATSRPRCSARPQRRSALLYPGRSRRRASCGRGRISSSRGVSGVCPWWAVVGHVQTVDVHHDVVHAPLPCELAAHHRS
jgi:integrase